MLNKHVIVYSILVVSTLLISASCYPTVAYSTLSNQDGEDFEIQTNINSTVVGKFASMRIEISFKNKSEEIIYIDVSSGMVISNRMVYTIEYAASSSGLYYSSMPNMADGSHRVANVAPSESVWIVYELVADTGYPPEQMRGLAANLVRSDTLEFRFDTFLDHNDVVPYRFLLIPR